ncbi:hypothetical protein GCM10018790_07450 [Kitasatospora xanthocidica]|uniref:alpha/beta hydrolase n=1 Tax=Kitasatospora xanthocidica TaxID=83382 RepID=UPI00167659D7|nr:alpha/beta hydrolase [Kitasatospora xanthocidica]GHF32389.1 hypothetical protein GCM10018790_07450 [Kitasatospora xanthocidica]
MDIATLYGANLNDLACAKNAYDTLAGKFAEHIEIWQSTVVNRLSGWKGGTATQVLGDLGALTVKLRNAHEELVFVSRSLSAAGEAFALAQSHLVAALDDARTAGLTVAPDGQLSWGPAPGQPGGTQGAPADDAMRRRAEEIGARITAALNEGAQADRTITAQLNRFAQHAADGSGLTAAAVAADKAADDATDRVPPAGTGPADVKTWWDGLTSVQQQRLVLNHPDQVGNLDGVPAAARDQANRITLPRAQADLRTQLAALDQAEPTSWVGTPGGAGKNPQHVVWEAQRKALEDKLHGLQTLQDRLALPVTDGNPRPYLLRLDAAAQGGRAILALNDPDTADDVATFVPGTESRIGGVGGTMDKAKEMYRSAVQASPGAKVSTIAYVNYAAPQTASPTLGAPVPDAAYEGYAKDAEQDLFSFQSGLRATHQGAPSHNTVVGHSYGSTVVGYTMRDKGLPVDTVVFAGSPGVGVERAADLNTDLATGAKIDPGRVFTVLGGKDSITDWTPALDVDNLDPTSDDYHLRFGRDPMNPAFGAQHLPSQDTDHDHYWNANTPSWKAFGQVIAGVPVT